MNITVIIPAAGNSTRMGGGTSKALSLLLGRPVLSYSLDLFDACPAVGQVIVAIREEDRAAMQAVCAPYHKVQLVLGGADRTATVRNALAAAAADATHIAVHDAARPLLHPTDWQALQQAMTDCNAAILAGVVVDTVKEVEAGFVCGSADRSRLALAQTPQLFAADLLQQAHARAAAEGISATDDAALAEMLGHPVQVVWAQEENFKITYPADRRRAERVLTERQGSAMLPLRTGQGWDRHRLQEGRPLILGGVEIPWEKGLLGHSDADVLLHAVIDALLGAAALGDIGSHFPDTDEAYHGADSRKLLQHTCRLLDAAGWQIVNIDSTVIAQRPKLAGYIPQMRETMAQLLGLPVDCVSVKAKTAEGLGCVGEGLAMDAQAAVLLQRKE